jgi:hemoglobin
MMEARVTDQLTAEVTQQATLYERLGGYDAIATFAAVVVKRAMLDDTIGHIWDHKSEDEVFEEVSNFVDWLSAYWGGPARYHGRDLVTVHKGMGITEEYWDALFALVDNCYEEFGLAPDLRDEVDTFLRSFKPAIVGSPSFRQVVKDHPDMDITQGMKSVGVQWPTVVPPKTKPDRLVGPSSG